MKVLLIDPPHLFLKSAGYARQINPLGIAYIASSLAQKHDVRLLFPDQRAYSGNDPWNEIFNTIKSENPDVLALTAVTATFPMAKVIAQKAKQLIPELKIVLGGVHPSLLPEKSMNESPEVDYLIRGEGEIAVLELMEVIEGKRLPESVDGLVWRKNGALAFANPRSPIRDLDSLPFPMRENLVWPESIQPAFYQGLITTRGCPYSCLYCAIPQHNERKVRFRSPQNVCDEIEHLISTYGVTYLFFHDPVFTVNKTRTLNLSKTIIERDLIRPYCIQARVENIDEEISQALAQSGCHTVFFGIESGSEETLRLMNRPMPLDKIRKAVDLVKSFGMKCNGFFMVGLPWETEPMMRQTVDFAESLELSMIALSSASPFPGTKLWDMVPQDRLPESIDFRTPQVNLTSLEDSAYQALFTELRTKVDEINRNRLFKK